jgi:UDP-N-acetylmuramoyl-L-alanyl-D-glutamate--2,6-diaminopimelate ligase
MGEIATRLADLVVLTSDNPKHEDPEAIVDEIAKGARAGATKIVRRVHRQQAIAYAVAASLPGDVILVAGKGHETYQMVRGEFLPHSDVETLERLGFHSGA